LLSWIVAAVIWLWAIYVTIVRDGPPASALANVSTELALYMAFFVAVATVLAAAAMFLVRLIGRSIG